MPTIEPLELTRRLMAIPSPSGQEAEVGRFLVPVLESLGLKVTLQPVDGDRFNLIAVTGADPVVTLCTHIDVVPPHLESREDDVYLYGRGACDTKGILAAMLAAAEQLLAAGVEGFGLLLVVGEETDSAGAREANERADGRSRWVIVGEPTESRHVRGQKGALKADVVVRGRAAHSAHPERGDSALLKMMPIVEDLMAARWGTDEILGPGTLNVGELHAGVRANVIPGEARASLMVRVVDSVEATRERLEKVVGGRAEITFGHVNEPQLLHVPEGVDATVVAFNTDIPFLSRFGTPLLWGPGSILDAHSEGEKIAKKELLAAVDTYRDLVRDLLASG